MGRLARLAARLRGEHGGINVTIGSASAVVVAVVAIGAGAIVIPTVTGGSDPCAGFSFCDEFNGSTLDTSKWVAVNTHADLSNSEPGCYTSANVSEGSGVVTETVQHDTSFTCPDTTGSNDYPTGAIQWKSYSFTNGTLEVKAKVAGCTGCWPAIWMLGTDCQSPQWLVNGNDTAGCNWPNSGSNEVDVAEFLSSNFTVAWQNIFTSGGTTSQNGAVGTGSNDAKSAFHIYTMIRAAGSLTFKIDGAQTNRYTTNLPTGPLFLIINTSIGSNGGTINNATLPAVTQVDYVHVTEA